MTELVSGEAVVLDVPVARFPSRVAALIIDMAVQFGALLLLLLILGAAQVHFNEASVLAVLVTVLVLVFVGYPTTFETLTRGKSLGKMALGLRVVSDDGGPERFRQALVRGLAALVEIWSFSGAPALICSLLSAKGKRFGDLFAGTFVIQERLPHRPGLPPMLAFVPPPLAGWAQTLQLSALQDLTAEQAAGYLRRYWELAPVPRDQLGQQIAAAVAAQITPPPPPGTPVVPFLTAVLAVRRHREMARLAAQRGWPATAGPAPYPPAPNYPTAFPATGHLPAPQHAAMPFGAAQNGPGSFPGAQNGPAPFSAAHNGPAPFSAAYNGPEPFSAAQNGPARQNAPAAYPVPTHYPGAQPGPYTATQPAPHPATQPAPYPDGSAAVPGTPGHPATIPGKAARSEDQADSGGFAAPV
jgi:uncharacterized RDD family membrane protein YckC